MRRILLVLIALPLSGCLMELVTTTAIQGELAAQDAQSATRVLSYAKEKTANIELEQAIGAYAAEHGQYPPTLQALVPEYIYTIPAKPNGSPYGYDPQTGRLVDPLASPLGVSFTAQDRRNLDAITKAIYAYWEATGYYPRTLNDLEPLYMKSVPRLSSGGEFVYDPKTGTAYHPSQPGAATLRRQTANLRPRRGVPMTGAGPLGEVMTGIQIQNDLSNMNRSGTTSAGSAGRRGVDRTTSRYSQRQMEAVRELTDP